MSRRLKQKFQVFIILLDGKSLVRIKPIETAGEKMAQIKTNAMRILDNKNITYNVFTYQNKDGKIDGISVAAKIGRNPEQVYKTLVAQDNSQNILVFIIPVDNELDLKKAAKAAGAKKVEMIHVKDITKYTGYVRGGCSPIGMKKDYPIFIDTSASDLSNIIVSGGKIGVQIELPVEDLVNAADAIVCDLTR